MTVSSVDENGEQREPFTASQGVNWQLLMYDLVYVLDMLAHVNKDTHRIYFV